MSQVYTQQSITSNINTMYSAQSYAQQAIQTLSTSQTITPQTIAQMQQAYGFFQAMIDQTPYVTSSGQVFNFSTFGSNGPLGSQATALETKLNALLQSYGNAQIPSPQGGTVPVMDTTLNQPATLYDLVTRPNDNFSFVIDFQGANQFGGHCDSSSVAWCQGNLTDGYTTKTFGGSESGNITHDLNGNPIPDGGFNVDYHCSSSLGSGDETFTVAGTGAAMANYLSFSALSSDAAQNAQALDNFIQSYI